MASRVKHIILLITTVLTANTANANLLSRYADSLLSQSSRKIFMSFSAQQGSLLETHESNLYRNYYVGFDVKLGWQTDERDRNIYDASFRYPYYGVGYYMGNMNGIILDRDEHMGFGKPAALYAFWGTPIHRSKWWQVRYNISAGLSYNFNAYDPNDYPENVLIGSNRNAYIEISFDAALTLQGHSTFLVGLSFQHFSNGSYQKPNKGMNLTSASLAYQWNTYKNREKGYTPFSLPEWAPSWEWYVFWGSGVRMVDTDFDSSKPYDGKRWYCGTLSSAVLRRVSHRRKWGMGVDLFYFQWGSYVNNYRTTFDKLMSNRVSDIPPAPEEIKQVMQKPSKFSDKNFTPGIYLAHEVGYKRVWMVTDLGFYPIKRIGDKPSAPIIYERVGVKFNLTNKLFVGVSIKAHGAKADFTEWTVGYSIVKSKKESEML